MTPQPPREPRQAQPDADITDQAIAWFARLRADDVTPAERQRFNEWLNRHPDHRRAYQRVTQLWGGHELSFATKKTAVSLGMQKAPRAFPAPRTRMKQTALGMLCLVAAIAIMYLPELSVFLQQDYSTATGQQRRIELADGSSLTLNTASAIAVEYSATERRIHLLRGEAFFDVRPDTQRPFIVDSEGVSARAVGTQYLVHRYQGAVRVNVLKGIVEVDGKRNKPVRLHSQQQLRVTENSSAEAVTASPAAASDWLHGRLVLDNTRLRDALNEITRYHSGVLAIANPRIQDIRVSGSFDLTNPLAILETLEQTLPISMLHLTDRVILVY